MASRSLRNLFVLIILLLLVLVLNGKLFFQINANPIFIAYGVLVTVVLFLFFYFAHKYVDISAEIRKQGLKIDEKKPLVSCVLAVYNDEKIIGPCITSLLNSDYFPKEIIVVNDCSTDSTRRILSSFENNPIVKVIDMPRNSGKKKAIAEGLKIAKGDIFVFTDSDSVVEKTAISRVVG